jgi:hypothetical protein
LGSSQADETRSHSHTGSSAAAGGHSHTGSSGAAGYHSHTASSDSQGAHAHTVKEGSTNPSMPGGETLASGDDVTQVAGSYSTTSTDGAHAHNITVNAVGDHSHAITINAIGDHSHAITINATGGGETRPQNIAFLACIKY